MAEVTPMLLRHLLSSFAARQGAASDCAPSRVTRLSDKIERRQRQFEPRQAQPKSVCTSLRDICEM